MQVNNQRNRRTVEDRAHPAKWYNSPVVVRGGSLAELAPAVPEFERRSLGITQPGEIRSRLNERLDMIVRRPHGIDQDFVPVGVVSKSYVLIPHRTVFDVVHDSLNQLEISPNDVRVELTLTEYGERMGLSVFLPKQFGFNPGDGHNMALRLECWNSVDGSTRFRALMGWFRFVCSNGLVVGVTKSDFRRRHIGDLEVGDIETVLRAGLQDAEQERNNLRQWRKFPISLNAFHSWTEGRVKKAWGFKAATRVYHICHSSFDVRIVGNYKGESPSSIRVEKTVRVPGSPEESQNAFDVSQVLAWLAKDRNDYQEQLEWRQQILELMSELLRSDGAQERN